MKCRVRGRSMRVARSVFDPCFIRGQASSSVTAANSPPHGAATVTFTGSLEYVYFITKLIETLAIIGTS